MISRFLFTLLFLQSRQAQANVRELAQQIQCLCQLQQPACSGQGSRHFAFTDRSASGELRHYVVHVGQSFPQIYRLQPPSRQQVSEFSDPQMWLTQVGRGADQAVVVVKLDRTGGLSYSQHYGQPLASVQEELANWQEARRLENILWLNGIRPDPNERGIGDWLNQKSTWLAEGLEPRDGSLTEVVRRFDRDGLPPDVGRARRAETTYRDLFSECDGRQSLCRRSVNGTHLAQSAEAMDTQGMQAWRRFFSNRASVLLATRQQSLSELCPDLPHQPEGDQEPSVVESDGSAVLAPVRTTN